MTNRLIPKTLDINFRKTDGSGNSLADAVFQLWVDTGNGTYALTTATGGYKDIKYNAGTSGAVDESLGTIRVNQKAGDPSSGTDVQSCFKTSDLSEASADAVMSLKGIPYGKYKLVEVASPDGYIIEVKEIFFEAAETGVTSTTASDSSTSNRVHLDTTGTLALLTVDNVPGAELPATGGPGTRGFHVLGALLVMTALLRWCDRGSGTVTHSGF